MKKNIILFVILAIVILVIVCYQITNIQNAKREVVKYNSEFEKYTEKEIYGTDIATIINKAIDNNERNKVTKDDEGFYINDNNNYIGVEIHITTNETTYKMETINKVGVINFVSNFNLISFRCTDIKYHSNGKISKIIFTQTTQ